MGDVSGSQAGSQQESLTSGDDASIGDASIGMTAKLLHNRQCSSWQADTQQADRSRKEEAGRRRKAGEVRQALPTHPPTRDFVVQILGLAPDAGSNLQARGTPCGKAAVRGRASISRPYNCTHQSRACGQACKRVPCLHSAAGQSTHQSQLSQPSQPVQPSAAQPVSAPG